MFFSRCGSSRLVTPFLMSLGIRYQNFFPLPGPALEWQAEVSWSLRGLTR